MIYLHVPFCESRCTYCGFFSIVCASSSAARPTPVSLRSAPYPGKCSPGVVLPQREARFEGYAEAVCREIEERREEIAKTLEVNTLYFGGGTPSVLPLSVFSRIVRALGGGQWDEFTIEVNPEDVVEKGEEYVRGLIGLGVNRISMGIQSFDDGILRWMNRRHDSATAVEAFHLLRRCGVDNISIDLIFGLPHLSEALWSETLDKALALGAEHISAYQLSIEEDSALERLITQGKFAEATDEQCRRQYDLLCSKLDAAGYRHYEISNFALPGREAVHNSAYWHRVPYVGLGPGAHSLSAGSVRSWNSEDIPHRLRDGSLETYSREEEHLTPEDIRVERIMLPLRTGNGLPEPDLRSLAGDERVDLLLSEGALVRYHPEHSLEPVEGRSEGYIRIPEDHFFTSDDIIRQLI